MFGLQCLFQIVGARACCAKFHVAAYACCAQIPTHRRLNKSRNRVTLHRPGAHHQIHKHRLPGESRDPDIHEDLSKLYFVPSFWVPFPRRSAERDDNSFCFVGEPSRPETSSTSGPKITTRKLLTQSGDIADCVKRRAGPNLRVHRRPKRWINCRVRK